LDICEKVNSEGSYEIALKLSVEKRYQGRTMADGTSDLMSEMGYM
jgi:hypothetical protein